MTTSAAPGSARRERAERTRAAIVAAAREAFVTRGYRPTSLRDVAAAAGISHPGLLRHFATKGELLAAVVDGYERDNEHELLQRIAADEPGTFAYGELARRNASLPGYLALFAALTGEASSPGHPAHDIMRDRYARLREYTTASIEEAIAQDAVSETRDPSGEAVRIPAAWDGLQLLSQYLPDRVDVAAALDRYEEALTLPVGWRDADDPPPAATAAPVPPMPSFAPAEGAGSGGARSAAGGPDGTAVPAVGYRVGRERRSLIIDGATALFAREGYGDTSLRDVAERVGVSKSTLLHHFASKEQLLSAVLSHRDRLIGARSSSVRAQRAADELRALPLGAAENADAAPGLIEVYAVLSCEAVPADHPAHAYFEHRFHDVVSHFSALFHAARIDGDLPSHRDPDVEALWLVALWDGLQYQWLYDRDAVDVAAHLGAHLEDVLPRV